MTDMNANAMRGEVEFKAGDATHILRIGPASALLIQKKFEGKSLTKVVQERFGDPQNVDFEDVVTVIWAAMQRKGTGPTRDDVIDILDETTIMQCVQAVGELFKVTFGAGDGEAENPPAASRT